MITVIIAGGSGTRLWPLSTSETPKQLLQLVGERSLVQQAYDRALRLGDTTYVVTEASHAEALKAQLPELPEDAFLIEPGRRGTGNCIVFALDNIARRHAHDEPIAFVHSDHHIRDIDGYVQSIQTAAKSSTITHKITLVGIEPTFPSTSFGYIERDGAIDNAATVFQIESFKEKPDYATAQHYLDAGNYLWNCGYFVGSVETFLDEIRKVSPELTDHYEALAREAKPMSDEYNQTYLSFNDQVIDYALSEKSSNLAVASAQFDWMDIGNFKDLHDVVPKDEQNNAVKGQNIFLDDVENSYIRNEAPATPVVVIGLDNVVVVNTPDGILVARKDVSERCGSIAKKIQK